MELLQATINKKHQIESNLADIEQMLQEKLSVYDGVVVTEDTIVQSKKDVAEIRKIKTSIDDARKKVKKEWMGPYEEFEAKCDKLQELCDKPINEINSQVKVFEEKRKADKKVLVEGIYENKIGEYKEYLPFESIFDPKWLNVSTTQKDIEYDISEKIVKIKSDIDVIKGLGSEIEAELFDIYKKNGNSLVAAMNRNQQYVQDKLKIQTAAQQPIMSAAPKEDFKPNVESTRTLNDMVEMAQTVRIIVSKADLQLAKNALDFNEISYRVEGE